jgi:TRAP-type mannitol/chloroaromatic compound transport system permease large subunit
VQASTAGLVEAGGAIAAEASASEQSSGLIGAPEEESEPQALATPPGSEEEKKSEAEAAPAAASPAAAPESGERLATPAWFYAVLALGLAVGLLIYWLWNWERLQVFKLLLSSFFPLALLILAVLGSIVVGLATPAEAAAVGAFGGFVLAAIYRFIAHWQERRVSGASTGAVMGRTMREF